MSTTSRLSVIAFLAPMAAAPLAAQTPFELTGPALVDFSQLPRDATGNWVVTFSGSGFTSPMLLAASLGPFGPWVIPHRFVNDGTLPWSRRTAENVFQIADPTQDYLQGQLEANQPSVNFEFLDELTRPFFDVADLIDVRLERRRTAARLDIAKMHNLGLAVECKGGKTTATTTNPQILRGQTNTNTRTVKTNAATTTATKPPAPSPFSIGIGIGIGLGGGGGRSAAPHQSGGSGHGR